MRWNPTGDDSRQTIEEYNAETGHREEMLWHQNSTYAWNPNLQDGTISELPQEDGEADKKD